ncbi:hypothetical protein [Rhodococcoides yunnanense]|uniref:hypothetical protein n=1 Tax=Rhodococcoides yunnanense TaxID=278209 RepID=UPI001114FF77|nr:hypothetical protein [Rhodococcus yunnanensis]
MLPPLSPSLKEKDGTKWMAALSGALADGEQVHSLARISSLRPLTDAIAITDRRVVAFFSGSVGTKGPLIDIPVFEIQRGEIKSRGAGRTLVVVDGAGQSQNLGTLKPVDVDFVIQQINAVARAEPPRAPTVDVYDPFTKPWTESKPASEEPDIFAAPLDPAAGLRPVDGELQPMAKVGVARAAKADRQRLVPLWKSLPAIVVAVFFGICTVAAVFDPEAGLSTAMFFGLLVLVSLLALSRARRTAMQRRAVAAGTTPVYGVFARNWLPVGIPLAVVLFIGFVALA